MSKKSPLPLRPNVCILLQNSDGKLLLGKRLGSDLSEKEEWQFPQGGVKKKYSLEENVLREIEEELGLSDELVEIKAKLDCVHEYEWFTPPKYAADKYRGQSQTFWLVEFLGSDSDINVATEEPEFSDWIWVNPDEVLSYTDEVREEGYRKALNELSSAVLFLAALS